MEWIKVVLKKADNKINLLKFFTSIKWKSIINDMIM